jgi:uncharacterized protein YqeY
LALSDQVDRDLVNAMKAHDTVRLSTLRLLKAAAKNAQVEKRAPLTEDEYLTILRRQAKMRREAAGEYDRAKRADLADQERAELAILDTYLPKEIDDSVIAVAVDQAINEIGATGPGEIGKVMSRVMPQLRGQADGSRINRIVRERLASRS